MNARVLIVDDDKSVKDQCLAFIGTESESYEYYLTPEQAMQEIKNDPFSIAAVFMDHIFYDNNKNVEFWGSDYIQKIKSVNSLIEVIMISGDRSEETFSQWVTNKADNHIFKDQHSWHYIKVLANEAINHYHQNYSSSLDKRISKFSTPDAIRQMDMVGVSLELEEICKSMISVAKEKHSVLLIGESGTGKELSAKGIHKMSGRSGKLVSLNFGQYHGHDSSLEAELFGTVKGKFTDVKDSPGLIEEAAGGTLFLDEIHCMPEKVQTKLLRFLNDGMFRKVGATKEQKSTARIVCAGNLSLLEKFKTGEFKEDLFYRIRQIKIDIPPLRERQEDIEILCWHFLNQLRKEDQKLNLSDNALKFIRKQKWKGNARDLYSLFCELTLRVKEPIITEEHIKKYMRADQEVLKLETIEQQKNRHNHETRLSFINSWEVGNGSPTEAANILGISRQRWMTNRKLLGLEKVLPIKKKGQGITVEQQDFAKRIYNTIKQKFTASSGLKEEKV